jgi:hypothetical protein
MTTTHDDDATIWRDLADYLTPGTIRHYEGCEHAAKTEAHLAFPNEDPEEVLRRVQAGMLEEARQQVPFAHTPLPAAAEESDTWQDDGTGTWSRVVFGPRRDIAHMAAGVDGVQHADGSATWSIYVHADDDPTTADQARAFAAALIEAADDLNRLKD